MKRSDYCGSLTINDSGREVTLCGWVNARRNLGSLLFITLRDREGIVQLVLDEGSPCFEIASRVRGEYVLCVSGRVREREGNKNPNMPTGDIEVLVESVEILSESKTPPFEIEDDTNAGELLRLEYRYLDLRRPYLQRIIKLRHKVLQSIRRFYDENGFYEIETPLLTKSTPEGARDYVVPSRLHPGKFYALPQSPQQYKQLLMVAGVDKYFQIARCMRDEDLRADRQPDFTQLDVEMSFVGVDDVLGLHERLIARLFKECLNVDIKLPLRRITWHEATERYGSDKPDLRYGLELINITDIVAECGFGVFSGPAKTGSVRCINAKGLASRISRKEMDALGEYVRGIRGKGLAWLKRAGGEISSSFAKFMTESELAAIYERMDFADGDVLLIVADASDSLCKSILGALRVELAKRLKLAGDGFEFAWITEFPLFSYSEEEGRFVAEHHPFTAPMDEDSGFIESDPARCRAKAYDMVLNGYELCSGSVRIHDSALQSRMFKALGFSEEQIEARFGHMIRAFSYGVPPHGGIGYGLDRIVMLMAGTENIRDVIAFPKTQSAVEVMMGSPSEIDARQLEELSIALKV